MPRKSSVSRITKDVLVLPNEKKLITKNIKSKTKRNKDDRKLVKNIYIGATNAVKWNILKNKLNYESDVELVQYLLELADPIVNRSEEKTDANSVDEEIVKEQEEPAQSSGPDEKKETENVESNDSPPAAPSPEDDDRDTDWQPVQDSPVRKSPRKPRVKATRGRRGNHRHHRKKRHRRGPSPTPDQIKEPTTPEQSTPPPDDAQSQQILKEDNHKHHHEKHKSSMSRGRKKHKRKVKDGDKDAPRPEKLRALQKEVSPAPETPPTLHVDKKPPPEPSPRAESPQQEDEDVPPTPPPPAQEKHRRKHKHRESKKRNYDVHRSPDEDISEEVSSPPPCCTPTVPSPPAPPTLELPPEPVQVPSPVTSELRVNGAGACLAPPHLSPIPELQPPAETLSTSVLSTQRVAIRIKLCADCGCRHVQDACPLHRPAHQVPDAISRTNWSLSTNNKGNSKYSKDSLPHNLFCLEERDSNHGLSVIVTTPIARYTQFGPLIGEKIREMDIPDDFNMKDIWEVCASPERFYLSTMDSDRSNWLRYIRPAPNKEQRNVAAVVRGAQLYFVTICALEPGTELLFWLEYSITGWAKKKMEKTNCGGCNLRFSHSLYYRLHCSVFHDPNFSLTIRKYHCKVCGLAVLGKENIMRHAAEQHAGKGAYQCQFCKKFFLRLNYLEMHRTYGCAANPQRTRPLCDFCGRKFCQPQKLKVHIKRMHSDMAEVLKEFQCKMCLKLLGSRAALQRHLKEVHHKDLVGACTCDRCGKMFQNKSNLKIHMLTHSGVKPFRCAEGSCAAAFTTKQCLQFHYKKVHGFTEDSMPKIERCVAYTFDAYAGGNGPDDERPNSDNCTNSSPPFTPAGTEDSGAASPAPTIPSLDEDDDEDDLSPCSSPNIHSLHHEHLQEPLENTISIKQHAPSPSPPPPILRQISPAMVSPSLEMASCRPVGGILSKASKKWMGDVLPPSSAMVETLSSPTDLAKRWPDSVEQSPEIVEKKWSIECLPAIRSPEMLQVRCARPEITFARVLRPTEQELAEQGRRSPSPPLGGGEFSPLRRSEPSASLLVEAALDAAERDLSGKLADLKPLIHDPSNSFLPRMNGLHTSADTINETDYSMLTTCAKPPSQPPSRLIPETGLDMSYKQYDNNDDLNSEFRVLRSPDNFQQEHHQQEQGLDMSRNSGYNVHVGAGSPYHRYDLLPPHLHPHHRAAVAAAGLMYEMEPARCNNSPPPPVSPPSYQAELLRHHWHHLSPVATAHHHTLDLSTARVAVQQSVSPDQSISPPPPPPPNAYQNYPLSPSPYHAPPPNNPRATTPTYHHYSGYY